MGATDPGFEELLEFLRSSHGFDFTGYKRSSLMRRIRHRIDLLGLSGVEAYLDHLQADPTEFVSLFDTILINVTAFFRDPVAWTALRESVLPHLLEHKRRSEQLRVWSAGCATGQEAYSVAMAFAELIGVSGFADRVKVFATDVDEEALQIARHGSYHVRDLAGVDEELRGRYFEIQGSRATLRADLRRCLVFGRHDLLQDAPISRIDLLVCRNTLMYFIADAQARILARMHYALNNEGVLFLGRAEMLLSHTDLFVPLDQRSRIFAKVPRTNLRERLQVLAQGSDGRATRNHASRFLRLRDASADAVPVAQVVLDALGAVAMLNVRACTALRLAPTDIGVPFQDLELSHRPVDLRSALTEAKARREEVVLRDVETHALDGDPQFVDIRVTPLWDTDGLPLGTSLSFTDVSAAHALRVELVRSKQDLETAYEELQSSSEELETTNEELRSTVEELETANEVLQSANEELETMNEELQSTNGELQEMNSELDRVNAFMESVLSSMRLGVVVLDPDMRVQIWNGASVALWGPRPDEVVGAPFLGLDIGLPVDSLAGALRRCATGETDHEEVTLEAYNRRGRMLRILVTCTPLRPDAEGRRGLVLLMEEIAARDPAEETGAVS